MTAPDERIVYHDPDSGLTAGLMRPPQGPPSLGDQVRELNERRRAEAEAEVRADEEADRRFHAARTGAVGMSPGEKLAGIARADAERQRRLEQRAARLAANGITESDFVEQAIPVPHSPPLRPTVSKLVGDAKAARLERNAEAEVTPASQAEVKGLKQQVGNAIWNLTGKRPW
jgi:hypothetical protein